jgi:DNA-binding NarL/FixJ family response regulator
MPSSDSLRLLLIDADAVFRLSVKVCLDQYADLRVVAEAEDGETALQILETQFQPEPAVREADSGAANRQFVPVDFPVNFIVLDVGLGQAQPNQLQGLDLGRILKTRYPALPLLFLSASPEPIVLAAAQQVGADGYCPKHIELTELVTVIRRVAAGQPCWIRDWQITEPQAAENDAARASLPTLVARPPGALAVFRRNLRVTGLSQIETALETVTAELRDLDLSLVDRAILAGQQRELRAARWLLNRLLSTPRLETSVSNKAPDPARREPLQPSQRRSSPLVNQPTDSTALSSASLPASDLAPSALATQPLRAIVEPESIKSLTFDAVLSKIQSSLTNQTEVALEIDILREDKKRDLLYLILRKFEDLLNELRYSQVELDQLPWKRSTLLLDLWQIVVIDFFGKYYTVRLGETDREVVETLLQDASIVQSEILDKIPGVPDLLQHFLFQAPLAVNGVPYAAGNPESLARAELLLENLTIQVANAVIQPLLNHFANIEAIKQNFYDRRLLSNREVERFRNDLSWRYRLNRVFREPKDIFESQYRLFTLTGRAIKQTSIYAPRTQELADLSGLPYLVTLALETRDAVAPRLRSVVAFAGNGFVYVLTEVIGRGLGLVGRGILKGLGNVWQDTKHGRDRNPR